MSSSEYDYPFIRAWCRLTGALPPVVDALIVEARSANQPPNVIYRRDNGNWATVDTIQDDSVRELVNTFAQRMYMPADAPPDCYGGTD